MEPNCSLPCSKQPTTCPYSEMNAVNASHKSYFININFKIILTRITLSMPWSSKGSPSSRFPHQNPVCIYLILLHKPHAHPSHAPSFDCPIIFGEQFKAHSSSCCSVLHCHVTSPSSVLNTFLSTLLPNILSPCSSLNVTDQTAHP
jgi:hypothetical protein